MKTRKKPDVLVGQGTLVNTMMGRYPADCRGLAALPAMTRAFVDAGWAEADIRGLLGGNLRRVLGEIWG